jgi:hypothetical protein
MSEQIDHVRRGFKQTEDAIRNALLIIVYGSRRFAKETGIPDEVIEEELAQFQKSLPAFLENAVKEAFSSPLPAKEERH